MSDYDLILESIRRIMRAVDLQSKALAKSTGLTVPQMLVMKAADELDAPTPSRIAEEVLLSKATITAILDRLEKAGQLTRDRAEDDKRQVIITLTAEGRARLQRAPELLQSGFRRELRALQDWERSQIIASLQRVAAMMDAEDIDAAPILDVGDITRTD